MGSMMAGGVSCGGGAGATNVAVGWGMIVAEWAGGVVGGGVGFVGVCVGAGAGDVAVGGKVVGVFVAEAAVGVGGTGMKVGVAGGESWVKPRAAGEKALANANVRIKVMIPGQKSGRRSRA